MKSHFSSFVILIALLLLTSCGKDNPSITEPDPPTPPVNPNTVSKDIGSDGGSVTSSDDLLTLTIPAGAIANTETITITQLDENDLGNEFEQLVAAGVIAKAYELGPEGLEFDQPIIVTSMTDQNPIAEPDSVEFAIEFLLTSDNGKAVEPDSLQTIVDLEEGTVTVQGQISHFSPLVHSLVQERTGATGKVSFSLPQEVIAGPDTITGTLLVLLKQELDNKEPFIVTRALISQYSELPLVAVSPGEGVSELPPGGSLSAEMKYRCPEEGIGKLTILGDFIDDNARQDVSEFALTPSLKFGLNTSLICVEHMPSTFNLQITLDGDGSGSVSSNQSGIGCPDDCEEEYEEGTLVTLTATPEEGSEFTGWSGDYGNNDPNSLAIQIIMGQDRSVTATFGVEQVNSGFLQLGLFTLPVLTNPETIVVLGGPEQAFANFPSGSVPALVQGAEGFIVIDLINGEVLLDFTGLPGNASNGERIPLGALAVSRPGPGPNTLSVLVSYGQDNNNAEFGFNLFPYDIENQSFIRGPVSPRPSSLDASAIGGKIVSDEVVNVREGGFGINFLRYNSVSDEYLFGPTNESLVSGRYGFEQPVTAYGEFVDGALLVVNIIGDLYFEPRNRLIYSPSVLIGNVGEKIIKIRCKIPICVTTDESGDALGIILWDGLNQPIIGNRLQVGDGPVDPDLHKLPNGNTLIGATGFNDNTISLLEVDPVGIFISGQIYNAPDGLVNPAHFHFINNPDDPTNPFVSITGFGSDNYYVQDTHEIGRLTVNAGVRPIE